MVVSVGLNFFLVLACSVTLTWWSIKLCLPALRVFFLDKPNFRSSHLLPTPRGGGFAFVLVSSVSSALGCFFVSSFSSTPFSLFFTPFLALPLAIVGFLDDLCNISAIWRYVVQIATALIVISSSSLISQDYIALPLIFVLLVGVTAVINFVNFMDGMDGLVGGCMAIAISSVAIYLSAPWPIWSLVGSLVGFLLWNWSPAKVFMGDVGSTFLGAVFAGLVLQSSTWQDVLGLLLVATPLLGDACLCVVRRLLARQSVFQAHRLHLFQRLHQAGWPHARVSSLYIVATAVLASSFLWGGLYWVVALAALVLSFGIWLDQQVAVSFALASRS